MYSNAAQRPRRSARLQNKYNSNTSTRLPLIGDKHYLFMHDFQPTTNSGTNNPAPQPHPSPYPTISRSKRVLQLVHHRPNVFVIDHFLTEHEVDHMLHIAAHNQDKFSTSYTQSSGHDQVFTKERTSSSIFLQRGLDRVVRNIERRAADMVSIPVDNVEELQIVNYSQGQHFHLHHDAGTLINESIYKACNQNHNYGGSISKRKYSKFTPAFSAPPPTLPVFFDRHCNKWSPARAQSCQPNNSNASAVASISGLRAVNIDDNGEDIEDDATREKDDVSNFSNSYMDADNENPWDSFDDEEEEDDNNSGVLSSSKEEQSEPFEEFSVEMVRPVRLFSFFIYLNTLPEDGGGTTYFPTIDVKVRPERGKAVLWCNVNPDNVLVCDPAVIHRGMPVLNSNTKIGINIWIDQMPIRASYA